MPLYGVFSGDVGTRVALAASADEGASWFLRGTIATASSDIGFNEATIEQVADGNLLAIMRTAVEGGHGNLMVSRSFDDGETWSTPENLRVPFGGAEAAPRRGVDPFLELLTNGALVLSAGRDDNWVAVSSDGTGASWDPAQITYVNYSSQNRNHGTSGYTGLAPVTTSRLVLVGDNCANTWGCPATDTDWTVDGRY